MARLTRPFLEADLARTRAWIVRAATALCAGVVTALVFTWSDGIDRIRASVDADAHTAIFAQRLEIALEHAHADQLLARLGPAPGGSAGSIPHADDRDIETALAALRGSAVASFAYSRPTREAVANLLDHADPASAARAEDGLAAARELTRAIADQALLDRRIGIARVRLHERAAMLVGSAAVIVFICLLGGSVLRLLASRDRLLAARRSERLQMDQVRAAIEHMRAGIAAFDGEDRLILCNSAFLLLAGLADGSDLVGMPYATATSRLVGTEEGGEPPATPVAGRPTSGRGRIDPRVLDIHRNAMPAGGHMLMLTDVTRQLEDEAVKRRSQKMEVLGQLTGGVAHDFNNLLQALSANLDVLAVDEDTPPARRARSIEASLGAVERGKRLTRHLLAYARRQELEPRAIDLASLLRGLEHLLRRTLGDTIGIDLSIASDLWPVLADEGLLESALINLALNARDAMPTGGRIAIEAANAPAFSAVVSNLRVPSGDMVRIAVSDTGIGMTPEQLERAVEPFFTTKVEGAGTGLGLSLVHGFAKQSGGDLTLSSTKGVGTEARLLLPRVGLAPQAERPAHRVSLRGAGETLLLVEDDDAVREAVASGLVSLGYAVVEAGHAEAAACLVEQGTVRPDLLLTDVMMPGPATVIDLVRRARAVLPGLPVLFNTGDTETALLREVTFDERTALLAKPWRLEELARRLRRMIEPADAVADAPAPK